MAVTATSEGSVSGSIRSKSMTTDVSRTPLARRCSGTGVEPGIYDRVEISPKAIGVDARRTVEYVSHELRTEEVLASNGTQFPNWLACSCDDERLSRLKSAHDVTTGVGRLPLGDRRRHVVDVVPGATAVKCSR
jgi:hypothetical protein